jgi:mutator protein MutT
VPETLIPVLAAVINRDGHLLVGKRPRHKRHGGLWEFPGGKLLDRENFERAARRELREELGVEVVSVGRLLFEQRDPSSPFLIQFVEIVIQGEPQPLEHEDLAWVSPARLLNYDLAPTDRRGAWYRVVTVTRLEAVVDVQGESVSVALPFVELRTVPPREWTIVGAAEGRGPANLQSGYVVCPNCRHRAVLPFTRVLKLQCSRCNQLFPIAWDEGYLQQT